MYVWHMNDGSWRISEYTSTKYDCRMSELDGPYVSRAEAETALAQWRERHPDAVQRKW